jgi:hypothetical protein
MRLMLLLAAASLAACSPPASKAPEAPAPSPPPAAAACNSLAPDFTKLVTVEPETTAALQSADLSGGPINPGTYDLTRATRIGAATGWSGARAVVLEVAEANAIVTFNWAGAAPGGATDTWSAHFTDTPAPRLTYTCGRIGEVDAPFVAAPDTLDLRVTDGANGSLHLAFARRK